VDGRARDPPGARRKHCCISSQRWLPLKWLRSARAGRMASQVKDRDAKAAFIECARQWQVLARQKGELDRNRSKPP
jgi:hypothetical protein